MVYALTPAILKGSFLNRCNQTAVSNISTMFRQISESEMTNSYFVFAAMQKKVFRVLATDFCCWFPISLMAVLSINGVPISNTAYAVSAIVLLPINSALNPIVYSNAIDVLSDSVRRRKTLKTLFTTVQVGTSNLPKSSPTPVRTQSKEQECGSGIAGSVESLASDLSKETNSAKLNNASNSEENRSANKRDLEDVSL